MKILDILPGVIGIMRMQLLNIIRLKIMENLKGYLNIPVEMCFYALKNKIFRPFQVYIYLKILCSGKMQIGKFELRKIA